MVNRPGQEHVVRIEPGDDLAARQLEAFVDRIRLPAILLRNEGQPAGVLGADRRRFVRRERIDDDVLDVGVFLR